eukprot:25501-Eustigmatos_ZCMA.PRE.1
MGFPLGYFAGIVRDPPTTCMACKVDVYKRKRIGRSPLAEMIAWVLWRPGRPEEGLGSWVSQRGHLETVATAKD